MKFLLRGLSIVLIMLLLACTKITQENFDKIQPGMSMQEVTAILGDPTKAESFSIGVLSGTSAVWKKNDTVITVQFLNDKVQIKALTNQGKLSSG